MTAVDEARVQSLLGCPDWCYEPAMQHLEGVGVGIGGVCVCHEGERLVDLQGIDSMFASQLAVYRSRFTVDGERDRGRGVVAEIVLDDGGPMYLTAEQARAVGAALVRLADDVDHEFRP